MTERTPLTIHESLMHCIDGFRRIATTRYGPDWYKGKGFSDYLQDHSRPIVCSEQDDEPGTVGLTATIGAWKPGHPLREDQQRPEERWPEVMGVFNELARHLQLGRIRGYLMPFPHQLGRVIADRVQRPTSVQWIAPFEWKTWTDDDGGHVLHGLWNNVRHRALTGGRIGSYQLKDEPSIWLARDDVVRQYPEETEAEHWTETITQVLTDNPRLQPGEVIMAAGFQKRGKGKRATVEVRPGEVVGLKNFQNRVDEIRQEILRSQAS